MAMPETNDARKTECKDDSEAMEKEKERKEKEKEKEREKEDAKAARERLKREAKESKESKAQERVANLLNSHDKTLASLNEVTPEAIWKSLIRATELDRRTSRSTSAVAELRKLQANPVATPEQKSKAEKLAEDITSAVQTVSAMKELSKCIRQLSSVDLEKEINHGNDSELAVQMLKCARYLQKDHHVLMDMIQDIPKKLLDVPHLHGIVFAVAVVYLISDSTKGYSHAYWLKSLTESYFKTRLINLC